MNFSYEATSKWIDRPGGRLHYHDVGQGAALIMLHGSGPGVSGWANFHGQLPRFAQQFRCLILDMPGFGASALPEGEHPAAGAPAAVIAFCEALGITQARFIGNSLGGVVASSVAIERPELVTRFVSIGGIGVNIFSTLPAEGLRLLVEFVEQPSRESLIRWLKSMVYDPAHVTEELIQSRLELATKPETLAAIRKMYSRAGMEAIVKQMSGVGAAPAWANLAKIKCPTLLVWGRDDKVSPIDLALLPMRLIPKCELHTFYDCGHWVMLERKAEFENVVLAFLTRA